VNHATIRLAPIQKSGVVPLPQARAFEIFTGRMSDWWFPGQGIGPTPFKAIVLEPQVGGRWFERAEDSVETLWGDVLEWSPPSKILLAWRIGPDWKFNPELETLLEIRFERIDDASTKVILEHRELGRLGDGAQQMAESMTGGWEALLQRFVDLAHQLGK
jgi:uncharacterized protein YndB with AHSA1/START domain